MVAIGRVERITALVAALLGIATGIGYFWDRLSPTPTLAYFDGTASTDASQLGDGDNTALRDFLAQQGNNPVFLDLSVYVNDLSPRRTPACDTDPPAGMSAAADASSYVFWSLEPNHTCTTGTSAQQPSAVLFALDLALDQTIPGADVQIPHLPAAAWGAGFSGSPASFWLRTAVTVGRTSLPSPPQLLRRIYGRPPVRPPPNADRAGRRHAGRSLIHRRVTPLPPLDHIRHNSHQPNPTIRAVIRIWPTIS